MRPRVVLAAAALALAGPHANAQAPPALSDSAFARLVAALSEAPGYFPSDNVITNEDSYLHPIATLERIGVAGGAYLGVGPDQNFSYIAAVRPRIAFILDIRRDNLLELLLFKAIFALSHDRIEYLCLLFGRRPPADTAGWGAKDLEQLLAYVDSTLSDSAAAGTARRRVHNRVRGFAVPLSGDDIAGVARFHEMFIGEGLGLRWTGAGRGPGRRPDYRRLLLETDRSGRRANFLVREEDWRFLKSLEDRNLVVPVVGDFGGEQALPGIARYLRQIGEPVSMFYTSNVEQYLYRDGLFARFAQSVAQLPRTDKSVMVRSFFVYNYGYGAHPQAVPGFHSVQLVQQMDRFVTEQPSGGFPSYFDLVTRWLVEP